LSVPSPPRLFLSVSLCPSPLHNSPSTRINFCVVMTAPLRPPPSRHLSLLITLGCLLYLLSTTHTFCLTDDKIALLLHSQCFPPASSSARRGDLPPPLRTHLLRSPVGIPRHQMTLYKTRSRAFWFGLPFFPASLLQLGTSTPSDQNSQITMPAFFMKFCSRATE